MIQLTVLDQTPVFGEQTNTEAVNRSIEIARQAEEMGYHRYWVTEQHAMKAFACASPEILATAILSKTDRIRVGVAGILVGHYSSLKVAENVALVSALGKGRFDFGIGRTPGSVPEVTAALGENVFMPDMLDQKTDEIFAYLDEVADIKAVPTGQDVNERWILCGSMGGAARYAAENGLALSYAHFVNPVDCIEALNYYRDNFQPSKFLKAPKVSVAVNVIVADSDEDAYDLALPALNYYVRSRQGEINIGFPSQVEARDYSFNQQHDEIINQVLAAGFIGSKNKVENKLSHLIETTGCDEIVVLCIVEQPEAQLNTYQAVCDIVQSINTIK